MEIRYFLSGGIFVSAFFCGLFFLRFYRDTHDRFFRFFAWAFFLLSFERIPSLFQISLDKAGASIYLIRLCAFLLILVGIFDKNRRK